MNNLSLALDGAWRVLVAGLVLGAGLPAVFAAAVRCLGAGAAVATAGGPPWRAAAWRTAGGACLVVIAVAVALGITYLVASGFGYTLGLEHGHPALVRKH